MDFLKRLTFWKALVMPFHLAPVHTILIVIHRAVVVASAPLLIFFTANFVNLVLDVINGSLPRNNVIPFLMGIALLRIYNYVAGSLIQLNQQSKNIKLRKILRIPFMEKRVRLEFRHIESQEIWDLILRTWETPEEKLSEIFDNFAILLERMLSLMSYIVILLTSAPLSGIAIVIVSIPVFWLTFNGGKASYNAERLTSKQKRKYENLSNIMTSRETVHERNLFKYTEKLNEQYKNEFEIARKYQFKTEAKWFIRSKSFALAVNGVTFFAMFALLPTVLNGNITIGLFISLTSALFATLSMLPWTIPYNFQVIARNREYIKDLNEFFALSEQEGAIDLPVEVPLDFESLEFKDVVFIYPGTETKVLDGLNLKINAGKHYSFVGVNGAGKTTITKLITRLYDNYEGEILLNGKELRLYELKEIKAAFSAVFQDFAKYDLTLAENIALGKANGATIDEINSAIQLAGFSDKTAKLKNGINTAIGKTLEDGIDLSGGEWQRIAIARAVISPSPVKILDEPTAALDPVAESKMYEKFEEISKGHTTIFISHRLSSTKMSDEIFVIDGGKVAECGSHLELMGKNGIYAEMFNNQRSWYI